MSSTVIPCDIGGGEKQLYRISWNQRAFLLLPRCIRRATGVVNEATWESAQAFMEAVRSSPCWWDVRDLKIERIEEETE